MQALNSTNLLVLLGSGASFAAKNTGKKHAPSMDDLWDSARIAVGVDLFDKIKGHVFGNENGKDIEKLLSLCKMEVELRTARCKRGEVEGGEGLNPNLKQFKEFVKKSENAILNCVNFVSPKTDLGFHKGFLRRLAKRRAEKPRVKLFTTNYDRCIEEAAVARNLILVDGFSHSEVQRFNRDHFQQDIVRRSVSGTRADYLDGVFHLYKLHGSMDWQCRKSDGVIIRSIKHNKDLDPVLIYPRSSKYQEAFAPPYLDMFSVWQATLREPDTVLIISGFGFADDHISAPIWSALESNLSIHLVLCDPAFVPVDKLEAEQPFHSINHTNNTLMDYQRRILHLASDGDSRITVLNGRFSDLALALPEIAGKTDRQRLEARLERVRGLENESE